MIQPIEAAIVAQLASWPDLAPFQVEAWPEKVSEYKLRSPNGAVLVTFKGSHYGRVFPTDIVAQERVMEFEITTMVRNLRDHTGGYTVLDAIRLALTGFIGPGFNSGAFFTREGFIAEADGVYEFASYLSVPTTSVQREPEAEADWGVFRESIPEQEIL